MTMGDWASANACGGHSTNFAKLYRNAALIWYSVGDVSCAKHFGPGAKAKTKSNIAATNGENILAAIFPLECLATPCPFALA